MLKENIICSHKQKSHVRRQKHTVETTRTNKAHVYANTQMKHTSLPHTHSEDWRIAMLAGTVMRDGWLYLECYMPQRARGCVNGGLSSSFPQQWYRKDGCHIGKKITHLLGLWKPNWKQIRKDRKSLGRGEKEWMTDRQCLLILQWQYHSITMHHCTLGCISAYCFIICTQVMWTERNKHLYLHSTWLLQTLDLIYLFVHLLLLSFKPTFLY